MCRPLYVPCDEHVNVLPFYHVHVCDSDVAAVAAQTNQRKVLQQLAADGAGADHEVPLGAKLLLELIPEHGYLAVVSRINQ